MSEEKVLPKQMVEDGKGYEGSTEDLLPHRDPFLFIDKLLYADQKRYVGEKTFGPDQWFFKGHFPDYPVVPGVILIETLAQCGGAGLVASGIVRNGLFFLTGVNNAKFRRQVRPGDTVRMEIENTKVASRMVVQLGKAYVGDELAASAEFKCMLGPG